MPIVWLRVALACYAVGLLYALVALTRSSEWLSKIALHASYLGMVFHLVALVEAAHLSGQIILTSVHNSESVLAFLLMIVFMIVYISYQTTSPGIMIFPVVFLLTLVAAVGEQPFVQMPPGVRKGWLFTHITLIFDGYAALVLSFGASVLYLIQERMLKSKRPGGLLSRLPALEVIDDIGYRALLIGFPFMTLGLIAGTVVAQFTFGRVNFLDPKILLSLLMWAVYLLMVYTRWNAGWRGRRAAYLAAGAFVAALVAWSANYFSAIHRFVQS
jgi:ABC-type transport system involved in cytochrome c biogenesis permease subunit